MQPSHQVLALDVRRAASLSPAPSDREILLPAVTFVAFFGGVGLGIAVGSVVVAIAVMVLAACVLGSRSARRSFRRIVDTAAMQRRRIERRRGRERRLETAGVRLEQLTELTMIVDEIEAGHRSLAERFELDELLDRCADLAIAHEQCRRAMRMADRDQLTRELNFARAGGPGPQRRRPQVLERRIRCWDECKARAELLADEIASIGEFIRLLGQRSACPDDFEVDDGLDRRLADLDEQESALRQLSGSDEASTRGAA